MESKIFDVIKDRHSVRRYLPRQVEEKKINIILEAARLAPSASNAQPWHFYVVKDREKIKALGEKMPLGTQVVMNSFIGEAPLVIVATAGPIDLLHRLATAIVNKSWYYLDVAIALEHMVLTAWELGLGSCWVGWFDEKRVKNILDLPPNEEVVSILTLGYSAEERMTFPKHRKSLNEIVKIID